MRKVEEGPKLTQPWCPFFPSGCPPTYELNQQDGCQLNGERKFTCTLERACQPRPVVNGIVQRRNNKRREILLVRRKGTKVQPGKWAIPGGGIHCGESVEQAILREIREETGYEVQLSDEVAHYEEGSQRLLNNKLVPFQVVSSEGMDDCRNFLGFFGFCSVTKDPEIDPDDEFTAEVRWFDMDSIKELMNEGMLTPLDTAVIKQLVFRSI